MASLYYLISSLPMLVLGEKLPITNEEFMINCSDFLLPNQHKEIQDISLVPSRDSKSRISVVEKWKNWEINLRNRLVKDRAIILKKDSFSFLKEERNYFSESERAAQEALAADNPRTKEMFLDKIRWKEIDNLECGHHFDLPRLALYKLRLLLCSKWLERIEKQGSANIDNALSTLYKNNDEEN